MSNAEAKPTGKAEIKPVGKAEIKPVGKAEIKPVGKMEGLLVYVQTTRLVLFEFFTRFLRADGRLFRPAHGRGPGEHPAKQA